METCAGNDGHLIVSACNVITIIPQCSVSSFIRTILFCRWQKYALELEQLQKPIGLSKLLKKQYSSVLFAISLAMIMKCGFDASLVDTGPILNFVRVSRWLHMGKI